MSAPAVMADPGGRGAAIHLGAGVRRPEHRRFSARALLVAFLVVVGLTLLGGLGLVTPVWSAPLATKLSRFTETAVTAIVVFIAVALADEAVDRGLPRLWTYAFAVVAGAIAGAWLGWEVRTATGLRLATPPGWVLPTYFSTVRRFDLALIGILVGGLATFVHVNRRTALAARRRQHAAEQARAQARRRTLESQLQALQARVEPHFLFDTLQRIRALYRQDAGRAGGMLEDLTVYLRAALPHMRESTSTVEQELTLAHSWLDIVRRSGAEGRIVFDVAAAARPLPLPALIVLPLVQQAVTGVPAGAGALDLRLDVSIVGERLVIAVETSGDAFAGGIAGRPPLEQLQERLTALYGGDNGDGDGGGSVRLETRRQAGGSAAVVALPLDRRPGRAARSRAMTDVVIAEDEPVLRAELREQLEKLWPGVRIVSEAEDGIEALDALDRCRPQVMFLDIEMPGLSGLEVARAASGRCHVVFVTAFDQHAVTAFEQGAVDYVMKPFGTARLATAITRLRARLDTAPAPIDATLKSIEERSAKRSYLRWINAAQGQNVRLVTTDEICYFKADSKYTLVVTADSESLIKKPIKELLDELDPEIFWPIHRGVVVNVNAIALAHRKFNGQFEIRLKTRKETLAVSEPFAYRFRQM